MLFSFDFSHLHIHSSPQPSSPTTAMSHHAHFQDQQRTPPVEKEGELIDFEQGNKKADEPIPFSR